MKKRGERIVRNRPYYTNSQQPKSNVQSENIENLRIVKKPSVKTILIRGVQILSAVALAASLAVYVNPELVVKPFQEINEIAIDLNSDENNDQIEAESNNPYIKYFTENVQMVVEKTDGLFGHNYKVMQGSDNSTYLEKNSNNKPDPTGALYIDYRNNVNDQCIIMYGHNLISGAKFGTMAHYADQPLQNGTTIKGQKLYDEVNSFNLCSKEKRYQTDIASAFTADIHTDDPQNIINWVGSFKSEEDYYKKISLIKKNSDIETNVKFPSYEEIKSGEKQIIIFFTCDDLQSKERSSEINRTLVVGIMNTIEHYKKSEKVSGKTKK